MSKFIDMNTAPENKVILINNSQWRFPVPAKWKVIEKKNKDGSIRDESYWAYWPCGDRIGGENKGWLILEELDSGACDDQ